MVRSFLFLTVSASLAMSADFNDDVKSEENSHSENVMKYSDNELDAATALILLSSVGLKIEDNESRIAPKITSDVHTGNGSVDEVEEALDLSLGKRDDRWAFLSGVFATPEQVAEALAGDWVYVHHGTLGGLWVANARLNSILKNSKD
ncbi:MAG: hypothetical protein K2P90_04550 [Holosporales bacterium]|nr:hypothetical protein [Holosporales bacterium]